MSDDLNQKNNSKSRNLGNISRDINSANPNIVGSGCSVAIVYDKSQSIQASSYSTIRRGIQVILDDLAQFGGCASISNFGTTTPSTLAFGPVMDINSVSSSFTTGGYFDLSTPDGLAKAKTFVENYGFFGGETGMPINEVTNWQAGLISAEGPGIAGHFDGPLGFNPDVILFITDGSPTAYYTDTLAASQPLTTNPIGGSTTFENDGNSLSLAQAEADYIRDNNISRIIGLGIQSATSGMPLANLISICSNSTGNMGGPQENIDYFLANTFEDFDNAIQELLNSGQLCNTLSVQPICVHKDMIVDSLGIPIREVIHWDTDFYKLVFTGKHTTFICLSQGSLGSNLPTSDLYLTPGHKIQYNGKKIPVRKLTFKKGISYFEFDEPQDSYILCFTKGKTVKIHGVDVCQWGQDNYEYMIRDMKLHHSMQHGFIKKKKDTNLTK